MLSSTPRTNLLGAGYATLAALCFSLNDVGIKFLSDSYALHQIVLIRTLVGLATLAIVIAPFAGGLTLIRTRCVGWHLLRGLCIVFANSFLFLGLASLPIADAIAIYFIAPLIVTLLSVLFLRERAGPRRWTLILLGFAGVLFIVRPGSSTFQVAALFPMIAATLYAAVHVIARRIGGTESAATMTFWILMSFVAASSAIGLILGDGRLAGNVHPAFEFLVRAWAPIQRADLWIFVMLGTSGVIGGFLISQAYRIAQASFAAPFEYISMPLAVVWGVTVFGTFPGVSAWIGITLIIGTGLALIWFESRKRSGADQTAEVFR